MRKYVVIGGFVESANKEQSDERHYIGPANLVVRWGINPADAYLLAEEDDWKHMDRRQAERVSGAIVLRVDQTGEYNLERECESQCSGNRERIQVVSDGPWGPSIFKGDNGTQDQQNSKGVSKRARKS